MELWKLLRHGIIMAMSFYYLFNFRNNFIMQMQNLICYNQTQKNKCLWYSIEITGNYTQTCLVLHEVIFIVVNNRLETLIIYVLLTILIT